MRLLQGQLGNSTFHYPVLEHKTAGTQEALIRLKRLHFPGHQYMHHAHAHARAAGTRTHVGPDEGGARNGDKSGVGAQDSTILAPKPYALNPKT
jgi:hypothetical protein